jgi:simple sugar transport system permease protein
MYWRTFIGHFRFNKKSILKNERFQDFVVPFLSVILGFIVGAIIMIVTKHNPLVAYTALLKGAGLLGDLKRFGDSLLNMTPLILTGLSVAFAFRTGLFNIGAAGQVLVGGFVAVYLGITVHLPWFLHMPLCVVAAIIAGAAWAFIPGLLKAKFKIHEVVSTIMMNWIAVWTVYYLTPTFIKGNYDTESKVIQATASMRVDWMTKLFNGSNVNLGFFMALGAVVVIWFILQKTTFGFELKAVGFNQTGAEYAGIKVSRNIILSMVISGALAGLGGAVFYLGYTDNIKIGVLPSIGLDGIAVSLVGLNSPIGVIFSSFLLGFMNAGKGFMTTSTQVPNELVPIINGVIIFFAAVNLMLKNGIVSLSKLSDRLKKVIKKGGETVE